MRRILAVVFLSSAAGFSQPYPASLFDQMQWRLVGPFRAGRVIAVTGVPGDPTTFYFGSVNGGVWKTTSAGTVWNPVFDSERIASIGAIAVAPSNPNVIYAGSGEADMRSDIGFGDGIYKSTNAGKTWKNVGLRDSRQIARLLVDPKDPNLVYVAALGHAYGPNAERGVYRSSDGGATWQKVLDRGPETGAADLAFDPANPKVIYATMWTAKRTPWSVYAPVEGPGSGLYKSIDGGDHWSQISGHGLPDVQWGRASVAVATGGRRVFALIDAQNAGGLYRSDDAGETWTRTSNDSRIISRAWYFGTITVDPNNADIVYVPNVAMYRSTDGGRSFTVLRGAPGGDDYHILWIDPSNSKSMILGTDQGATITLNGGETWSTWYNQPTAQFYHVITDNRFPYFIYGCQQDSGTVAIASRTDHNFIDARDWHSVGGAESGYIAIDPGDQDVFYVGNTNGSITRFDRRSGQGHNITPWPVRGSGPGGDISQAKYRFPWTAPLVFSSLEPDTLYYGSQYLLKTADGGLTWQEISPDLTGADKSAAGGPLTVENAKARGYGVIYSIAPSPIERGMIWVGSDTGLIHLTRDGGKTWANVTPKGLPDWSKVTHIEASHFDPAIAYAAVDRHRIEDYRPYLYRTRDFGKTWTQVAAGIPETSFLNAIREDPERKGLLFAATELGVYVSFDDGDHWQSLQLNLPVSSMRDLVVHGDDLVLATHGRGFWVLDDITPLRQIDAKAAAAEALLYKPAKAFRLTPERFTGTPFPVDEPKANNPPDGAIIDYYFKSAPSGEVTLEILDAKGQVVRRYSTEDRAEAPRRAQAIADAWIPAPVQLTAKAGMNRFVWDLGYAPPGPRAMPGTYTVRLTAAGHTYTQPLEVVLDPRVRVAAADLQKRFDLSMSASRELSRAAEARRQLNGAAVRELTAITGQLNSVLSVSESADRVPPAAAYTLFDQAKRALDLLLAKKD
jgi:photosystem II stability/assembly factor-like uncharacterized protein